MQNGAAARGVTGLSSIHRQFNVSETEEYEAEKSQNALLEESSNQRELGILLLWMKLEVLELKLSILELISF